MSTSLGQQGAQAERTALSWQRTSLSFAVVDLLCARALLVQVDVTGYLVVLTVFLLIGIVLVVGHWRYLVLRTVLSNEGLGARPRVLSAFPLLLWAVAALCMAALAAIFLIDQILD